MQGEIRPGYKQTEVGVIPEGWDCVSVAEVAARKANSIVGGPFGSDLVSADYVPFGVPVIRGQNMSGTVVSGDFVYVSDEKAKTLKANTAAPGDLVFTQRGTLGQACRVPTGYYEVYVVSQSQMKLSPNPERFDSNFLLQYFHSEFGQRKILDSAIQTGVPHTNLGILRSYRLPAPPLPEQRAIAAALSDADALIAALEGMIAKKRDLKQAAMQHLLTGKTRLPGFSGEWNDLSLDDACNKIQDGTHFSPKMGGNDFPYITSKNVGFGRMELSQVEWISAAEHAKIYSRCSVRLGDLLLTKDGANTGNAAINPFHGPISLLSSVAFLRLDEERHCTSFFLYQILSWEGQRQIFGEMSGNAITRLTLKKIRALRVRAPSKLEQTAIAEVLSDMDADLTALETQAAKARAVKQGMMQELLTGRVRLV